MCGINSDKTQGRLLTEVDLTLEKAVDICRANEATATQLKTLGASNVTKPITDSMEIDTLSTSTQGGTHNQKCEKCGNWHK